MPRLNQLSRFTRVRESYSRVMELCDQEAFVAHFPDAPHLNQELHETWDSVAKRQGASEALSVIAFAGASGVGKSELINSLTESAACEVGTHRPSTKVPQGVFCAQANPTQLLELIGVTQSTGISQSEFSRGIPENLVFVDLPALEYEPAREATAATLRGADVIVWVTDPQRYADASFVDSVLSFPHVENTIVVLSHADTLNETQHERILEHLRDILTEHGLGDLPIYSAGRRLENLTSELLSKIVDMTSQGDARNTAFVSALHQGISDFVQASELDQVKPEALAELNESFDNPLKTEALLNLSPTADRMADAYKRAAAFWIAWPVLTWIVGFKPSKKQSPDSRTTLPGIPSVNDWVLRHDAQTVTRQRTKHLPPKWRTFFTSHSASLELPLVEALNLALSMQKVQSAPKRAWWKLWWIGQWILFLTLIASSLWLLVWAVGALASMSPPVLWLGLIPLPALLFVVGLLGGLLWSLWGKHLAFTGAAKFGAKSQEAGNALIAEVSRESYLNPLRNDAKTLEQLVELTLKARQSDEPDSEPESH